jgi:hypothetical protein
MLNKIIHLTQELLSAYWHVIFIVCLLALLATSLAAFGIFRRGRSKERADSRRGSGSSSSSAQQKTVSSSMRRLPSEEFQVLRDVFLPRLDGKGLTRLPFVVVARSGVFVIQPQRESGLISGGPKDERWTVMHGGREHSFTNPVLRSAYHARALARYLELPEALVCGIIYFDQEVRFASPQGPNVLTSGLTRFIMSHKAELLTGDMVQNVCERVTEVADNEELRREYEKRNSSRRQRARREASNLD